MLKKIIDAIHGWAVRTAKDFVNIYHIENEEELRKEVYSEQYVDNMVEIDPTTGKRKISAKKIFQRVVVVAIFIFFVFIFVRIGTNDSFWAGRQ